MAATAHRGQFLKRTKIPYIVHCIGVASAVHVAFGCQDPEVIAAAIMHHLIEKTKVSKESIHRKFGARVALIIDVLTKPEERRASTLYWERLTASTWESRLVKMADALDHLVSPAARLVERIPTGNKALALAFSSEPVIQRAKQILSARLDYTALQVKQRHEKRAKTSKKQIGLH
ncbi:HD domain-containing protein [Luteolibacter ambystomatis]|uniref:HD domain-containing protein n=1 Tax=Luteolibacter ambystomatis TaxID=2824561 RepID=A0A975G4M3_9BACT|nr:HD domain-containing protein [Luteolibacter ambystomatis]QUE49249.1 HD domain-containing protein [Luteolibacter ambystomatis]